MTLRISRDQIIAGVPAVKLRSLFKRTKYINAITILKTFFNTESIFGNGLNGYYKILLELKRLGYIEDVNPPQADDPESLGISERLTINNDQWNEICKFNYKTTDLAAELSHARAGKPIKREKAWRNVKNFLSRCRELQRGSQDQYLWEIKWAWFFGSLHHSEKPEVNDIDIAIILCPTIYQSTPEGQIEEVKESFNRKRKVDPTIKFLRGETTISASLQMKKRWAICLAGNRCPTD